jgi:hypothetical protein
MFRKAKRVIRVNCAKQLCGQAAMRCGLEFDVDAEGRVQVCRDQRLRIGIHRFQAELQGKGFRAEKFVVGDVKCELTSGVFPVQKGRIILNRGNQL